MPPVDDLGPRRRQIAELLLRRGTMTIAELADALGVAKTSVRPQVDRLVLEGWLDRARRRQGPGRPADIFSASDRARQHLAEPTTGEFARLLLEEVADSETRAKVRAILDGVGLRTMGLLRPIIGEGPVADRVRRLSEFLEGRGILTDASHSKQMVTLRFHTCPYFGLADEYRQVCAMHRKTLAELLGGEASAHCCRLDGQPRCEFKVNIAPSVPSPAGKRRPRAKRGKRSTGR